MKSDVNDCTNNRQKKVKKDLTKADIYDIIDICGKSGVKKFKHGDLVIDFYGVALAEQKPIVLPDEEMYTWDESKVKPNEDESLLRDEVTIREDQLEAMLIEDPAGYEKLLTQSELHDAKHDREAE